MPIQALRRLFAGRRRPAPAAGSSLATLLAEARPAGAITAEGAQPARPVDALAPSESRDCSRRYTWEECYANLVMLEKHHGRMPRLKDTVRPPSAVGSVAYATRFGSWTLAIRAYRAYRAGDLAAWPMPGANPGNTKLAAPAARAAKAARNRRVRHAEAERGTIAASLRYEVLERDGHRCLSCGADPKTDPSVRLHIDHKIPLAKGGTTTLENLAALCEKCNLGKGTRTG
jgi:5-methylcytosine-specific restriction endonuclease McrA